MEENMRFKVNLGGMIDILSNHLYDSKDVYIRELLQNATDAIRARKKNESSLTGEIAVSLNTSNQGGSVLIFEDNGIGLTTEEVHEFLATIASSSKGSKRFQIEENDYIGRFGIGLLSCFIVSDEIVMISTSAKTRQTVEWRGNADGTYQIRELDLPDREPGTHVYLRADPEAEEGLECFEAEQLEKVLKKYGASLEIAIRYEDQIINETTKQFADLETLQQLSSHEILAFGRELYQTNFETYCLLQSENKRTYGIAYVIPYAIQMNAKRNHTVYLNNMFVTGQSADILPEWSFFTNCVLWTDELQPVASREDFYKNATLEKVAGSLGKALKKGIESLNQEVLERIVYTHFHAFKLMALEDNEFLELIYPYLPFRTGNGEESLAAVLKRTSDIYYTYSVDDFRQIIDLARSKGMEVINGGFSYDAAILRALSDMVENVQLEMIEPAQLLNEWNEISADEQQFFAALLESLNQRMAEYEVKVAIKKFESRDMPVLFINPTATQQLRELERAQEESNSLFSSILESIQNDYGVERVFAELYLNLENPLIKRLFSQDRTAESLETIVKMLYIQALLFGHYPLKQKEMTLMNDNYLQILSML